MRLKNLLWILLINSVFANAVNLIFLAEWTQTIWQNLYYALVLGLVVYGIQAIMLYQLCKPFRNLLPFRETLSLKSFAIGFSVAAGVWLMAQLAAIVLKQSPILRPSDEQLAKFMVVFVFNTVIGAFLEEFVFRFLPVEYGRQAGLSKGQLVLLMLGVTCLFALTHLSAYLFRDQVSVDRLANALWSPFLLGTLLTLIYAGTKNLYFVSLLHAFSNNDIYWVETPYSLVIVLVVTLLWTMSGPVAARFGFYRKSI